MKKHISSIVSISLFVSALSFNFALALTTSDIAMLKAAGILSDAQVTALTATLNTYSAAPVQAVAPLIGQYVAPTQAVQAAITAGASTQAVTAIKCAIANSDLALNANGDNVSMLQDFLASKGYLSATSRGYFGGLTVAAVKAFQSANGISPTGYVGPLTRAKMQNLCNAGVAPVSGTSVIPATVPSTVVNTIQTQVQNAVTSGTLPTNVQSVIDSAVNQVQLDCSAYKSISTCIYLPRRLELQCRQCKGL